jgi:hypothetical protein
MRMTRFPIALPATVLSSAPWNGSSPRVHRNSELSAPVSVSAGQSTSCAKWKRKAAFTRYSSSFDCALAIPPGPANNIERRTTSGGMERLVQAFDAKSTNSMATARERTGFIALHRQRKVVSRSSPTKWLLLKMQPGYSIFTSGVYRATSPGAAFPQEKSHFAALACAE